ncbi:MAG: hypothetical protein IAF94_16900 [Pirellulaceae bacterium]|nr:hypothetical protein [Pirellulaceae bacterium]
MPAVFDPYQAWLGIPRQEQPPHHYRLLDIAPLEADPAVIEAAAARQTKILQMQAVGPYVALAQQICGEVAAARYCLVTPSAKTAYDAQLRPRLAQAAAAPARPLPVAASLPRPLPAPALHRPLPAPRPQPVPQVVQPISPAAPEFDVSAGSKPAPKTTALSPRRPSSSGQATAGRSAFELFKIIAGAIAGLLIAVLILNYFVGIDPLGWSVGARMDDAKPKKVAAAKTQIGPPRVVPNDPLPPETRDPTVPGRVEPSPERPSNSGSPFPPEGGPPSQNGFNPPQHPTRPVQPPPEETSPVEEPRSLANLTPEGSERPTVPGKKSPLPSAAEQVSKLAAVKEIYQAEFAKAKTGANPEFVSFLLTTAAKVEGDPFARYVLYQEAFKQACAGSDIDAAAEAFDKLEAEFECEPFAPRFELLTRMGTSAKANDQRMIAAKGALLLLDHALALGKIAEADKLARIADTQTKIIIDKDLRAKAAAAMQTTSELAKDLKSFTDAAEELTQTPEDPAANLAVGRYRCLIEGKWDAGLSHLAKSNDDAITSAATMDLAGPKGEMTASKIGDAWYDLAKGGKGQGFYARADIWYQKGMEGESGLSLARLKRRHEEIGQLKLPSRALGQTPQSLAWPRARDLVSGGRGVDIPSTDLLTLLNFQRASPAQGWTKNGSSLTSPTAAQNAVAFVESSFQPPGREYSMQARITRTSDRDTKGKLAGGVIFGLTQKGKRFALVIDEVSSSGQRLAYLTMGTAKESQNSSVVRYPQIRLRSDDVVCNVSSDKITVLISGQPLLQYTGDMSALALPPGSPFAPAKPFFYAQEFGINTIDRWSIGPATEQSTPDSAFPRSGQPVGPKRK